MTWLYSILRGYLNIQKRNRLRKIIPSLSFVLFLKSEIIGSTPPCSSSFHVFEWFGILFTSTSGQTNMALSEHGSATKITKHLLLVLGRILVRFWRYPGSFTIVRSFSSTWISEKDSSMVEKAFYFSNSQNRSFQWNMVLFSTEERLILKVYLKQLVARQIKF